MRWASQRIIIDSDFLTSTEFQGFPELTWHIHQASRSGGCQSGKHENVKRRFAATIICGMGLFNDIHSCFPVLQIQNDSPLCVMFLAI